MRKRGRGIEGRKGGRKGGRKKGRKKGRKEGKKEGRKEERSRPTKLEVDMMSDEVWICLYTVPFDPTYLPTYLPTYVTHPPTNSLLSVLPSLSLPSHPFLPFSIYPQLANTSLPLPSGRLPPRTPPRILPPQQHLPAGRSPLLARQTDGGCEAVEYGHRWGREILFACRGGVWEL